MQQVVVEGKEIRKGMQLHEFIRENMQTILAEWEKFAKTLPPGMNMDAAGLRDHAKEILDAIVQDMPEPQSHDEQESKSKGESQKNQRFKKSARQHASIRLRDGFDFDHIVSEYRALRASVIRLWTQQTGYADKEALYQLTRFNEAIDQSLCYVIKAFSEQVEQSRRHFLSELHESEERHRLLAELSPDALLLVHQDDRYVYANPAAAHLFGTDDGLQIVGRSPFELLDPDHHEMLREQIQIVLHGGRTIPRIEYRWKKLDGSYMEVEVSAGNVRWNGKPAVQVIARDIGQRKQHERTLREIDRHKDEFLATLAHELRNPLAPIQTGIEVLRWSKDENSKAGSLNIMERQMVHLVRLVDDLLSISRISQGKVSLRFEKLDIGDAIRKTVEANKFSLYADRQVSIDLPPQPLMVKADAVRFTQIIDNLLSNAVKYSSANGHIRISASKTGQQAKISVQDDGIGIAPDKMDKLFQMFMQVDTTRIGGLGIGLALVRSLVELHGGSVEAHSEGLGHGSVFIVSLPLAQNEYAGPSLGSKSDPANLDRKRVLVVDDNEDAADTLGMLLELLNSEVRTVNGGPAALSLLEEFYPDMVLLDIGMPEMDGYEVAKKIRAHKAMADTRLVAVTGWGQEQDRQRSLEAGFNDHLIKPVSMEDLERVMARSGTLY
jgi:PAS domain S-box-containing protein